MTFTVKFLLSSSVVLVFIRNPNGRSDYAPKNKNGSYTCNTGQGVMEYLGEGCTWGCFVLEPGSGAGLVDSASSSLPVLFRCWLHLEAISPLRPFSDIRKHKDVLISVDNFPSLWLLWNLVNINSEHSKEKCFFSLPYLNKSGIFHHYTLCNPFPKPVLCT